MSANYAMRALARFPGRLLFILLYLFTLQWITDIVAMIRRRYRNGQRGESFRKTRRGRPLHCPPRCAVVRPEVYKRPDPLIYSQRYLMEQGLAVTWDNPDIQLYDNGVPVSSHALKPDTDYDVIATVYNNSLDAPAVGLPVEFSFRTFGVGAAMTPIGKPVIDLPVKGAPQHPAKAKVRWHTPATAGHYCLLVSLIWADDANPKNNVGQENTDVGLAASPAVFTFPVRNEDTIRKRIHMTADAYTIPARMGCKERPPRKDSDRRYPTHKHVPVFVPPSEKEADWTLARARHHVQAFPIPAGWSVDIQKPDFELAPGATQDVRVSITPPGGFSGVRSFNVNAMYGSVLLGGVTLAVRK